MARKKDTQSIKVLHPVCCGMDVHKKSITACLLPVDAHGEEQSEIREFGTFTKNLTELRNWLLDSGCPLDFGHFYVRKIGASANCKNYVRGA